MDPQGCYSLVVDAEWMETDRAIDIVLEDPDAEFVPEPGAFVLLGSGLVSLAGYATLRLRSGQALRRRTRD